MGKSPFFWHFFGRKRHFDNFDRDFSMTWWSRGVAFYHIWPSKKAKNAVAFLEKELTTVVFFRNAVTRQGSPAQSVECMGFNPQDASVYGKRWGLDSLTCGKPSMFWACVSFSHLFAVLCLSIEGCIYSVQTSMLMRKTKFCDQHFKGPSSSIEGVLFPCKIRNWEVFFLVQTRETCAICQKLLRRRDTTLVGMAAQWHRVDFCRWLCIPVLETA